MNISIALSLLILAVGVLLGWQSKQRQQLAHVARHHLIVEAKRSGLSLNSSHPSRNRQTIRTRHQTNRSEKDISANRVALDFIDFAREMEAAKRGPGPFDRKKLLENLELMDRFMNLDASQMDVLIAKFRTIPDLEDETRQNFIDFFTMTLANESPQDALALVTGTPVSLRTPSTGSYIVHLSLAKWAKVDPSAALEWFRTEGTKHPDLMTDVAKRGLITGTSNDPQLAFSLISELKIGWRSDAISDITNAAHTPTHRSAILAALREYLPTVHPGTGRRDEKETISNLIQGAAKDGFESATQWVADSNITPEQLTGLHGTALSNVIKAEETGRWIEWIGDSLPDGKVEEPVQSMVKKWTDDDYLAAGNWLANSPESPIKQVSVCAYAETVAQYEPDTAVQWAMTLPAGRRREVTLRNIYRNWPKNTETSKSAAEAFAESHGIDR